jgi:alpha-L-fucosidase
MANSWSYNPNDTYKSADELIKKLVDIVSKGGNYLLNIGPGPDGTLDTQAYNRLKEIGNWMRVNGEAIYGTRMYKVFKEGDHIRYTQSKDGKTKYIFLFTYPDDRIALSQMTCGPKAQLQLLGSKQALKWHKNGQQLWIDIPAGQKRVTDHVWVVKVSE